MITPVLPVYNRAKLEIDYGEGAYLVTTDGARYLDFVSGVAVNCLGHCHPKLIEALKIQSERLWHVSNIFTIPGMDDFAKELTLQTFADTAFFCNSGAEAIECCIKMVRKYHDDTGNPDKYEMITFTGAFHGRTLAAIWASKRDPMMQEGFGPPVEGFVNVEFENLEAVKLAINERTAGILVEPVQGDGGIRPASKAYLQGLRDIADEHGLLLCFDEIQCGVGRTGNLYAYEHYGVTPDIMTTAKGIGGGFPLGACLATEKAAVGMGVGTHGSTYGGNPLAMAVGRVVMQEVSKPEFLQQVQATGAKLKEGLETIAADFPDVIEEIRGLGLMLGIKTVVPNKEFAARLQDQHLLCPVAADNVVRLLPPLIIDDTHVGEALNAVRAACETF